jgi:hypothetical protein
MRNDGVIYFELHSPNCVIFREFVEWVGCV